MPSTATSTENLLPVELTIHDHYGRETHCAIYKLPAIIGRDASADVQLADPWISHRHCEISQIGDVLVVRDLDSKNGFSMHGHRVRESQVLSGERLTIGRTEIVVGYGGKPQTDFAASDPPRPSQNRGSETMELLY